MSMTSIMKADKCCQIGVDYESSNFDIQMDKINAKYGDQRKFDIEMLNHQFSEKITHMRCKIEEEVFNEYCRKLEDFKKHTQLEMKKELEMAANAALKKSILEERENRLNEMMTRSKETNEQHASLQRQVLTAEMEASRAKKEKLRQMEIGLERQRKELQESYSRRQAQLQVEEEKLLSRKEEFEALLRQEVERLRKCDEMEIMNRRKDIEIAESQIKIEKETLDAKVHHIHTLQRELAEKSALFSEMEITDYQTLKLKFNAASNEANTLKGRLKEAFEEIGRLKEEKSLLSQFRQENEHLRISLENERTEKRQKQNQLNQKIEELKSEKDRLEDRIREQDSELHKLRNRLADQGYQPTGLHIGVSTLDDLHSKNSSVPAIENASLNLTSTTIENARERLRTLDHESARIDEALSRWKEELFAPSSTILHMNNLTDDDNQVACPGNRLSTVHLANPMKSTGIRPLRNLAFIRSMPLEAVTYDVGKILYSGNSVNAPQPQQTSSAGDQYILRGEKSDDKQQPASLLSTESVVSHEGVTSAAEILQSSKVGSRKAKEVPISSQKKVKTRGMPVGDTVIETPHFTNNGRKISDSKLDLSHLSRNTKENAKEISPEGIINQLLDKTEEFNNGNDGCEGSSECTISELVSGTTESGSNQKVSEEDNTEFEKTTSFKVNWKENEKDLSLFSKSSTTKSDNSMKLKFEEVVNEQLDKNVRVGHANLTNKVDTSIESHLSQEWSESDLSRSEGGSNKSERKCGLKSSETENSHE
nr:hypothetical transcript [Hymenolepis microstoma]